MARAKKPIWRPDIFSLWGEEGGVTKNVLNHIFYR